jgi:hypothetical protein
MSHYRKIDTRIWNDEKFNRLSEQGKYLFLFLLTHPHLTALGAMRASFGGLSDELKWSRKHFENVFLELSTENFISFDEKNNFFLFKNFIKYNKPESPNVVKSWENAIDLLPECELRNQLIQQVANYISENFNEAFREALPEAFRKALKEALPQAFRKAMPNQKQEQKQKQNNIILNTENNSAREEIKIISKNENKKIFELPTKKGDNFPIFESDINVFNQNYPAVDVINELQKMKAWLTDKQFPQSYFAMREFITKWLSKAQIEVDNVRSFEKQGARQHGKTSTAYTKQPSPFEQAMHPGIQWAVAE